MTIPRHLLDKIHRKLYLWVAYLILPLFALTNAGVSMIGLTQDQIFDNIPLGIALGLFFGKQIGVFSFAWLGVKSKFAIFPSNTITWQQIYGMACLCGIGFTMSVFISNLAYYPMKTEYALLSKIGIIVGSVASAILGYLVLRYSSKPLTVNSNV